MARSDQSLDEHKADILDGLYDIAEDIGLTSSARVAAYAKIAAIVGLDKDSSGPSDEEKGVVYQSLADFYRSAK